MSFRGGRDWDNQDRRYGNSGNSRGQVRRREDDELGWDIANKRRRYDDDESHDEHHHAFNAESGRGHRGADRDDWRESRNVDQDDWRTRHDSMEEDTNYDQRQNWNKSKRIVASEPSEHVIFLGLDPDFMESDLLRFVQSFNITPDSVTIIRERISGASKGFGFSQFSSIDDAIKFVDPHFPFINVPPPQSHGAQAAQAYADGNLQVGRRVKIDYSQSAGSSRFGHGGGSRSHNDGTRDIGNSAAPVVLMRGLDPMSSLDLISDALRASSGPGQIGSKGMKRLILIKDKYTAMGIGLAFVEFVDSESAGMLLGALMSRELHPEGFRISDRPIASSFANKASFTTLAPHELRDEACVLGSQAIGGTPGVFAKYWDESTIVNEKTFHYEEPNKKETTVKEKKKKKKEREQDVLIDLAITDVFDAAQESLNLVASSTLPTNLKPLTLNLSKTALTLNRGAGGSTAVSNAFSNADLNEPEPIPELKPLDKAMTFRKVAPMIASKKVSNSISAWNQVSQELRHTGPPNPPAAAQQPVPLAIPVPVAATAKAVVTPVAVDLSEYCNTSTSTCYLCSRQLKTAEVLERHVKESDLHKKNLANEALRNTAREKAANSRTQGSTTSTNTATATGPKYRDRASERRIMHGQPDVPLPDPSGSSSSAKPKVSGPTLPTPKAPTPPPPEPAKDENNIGNKLLKKMGWNAGSGLGASGEGRVDPVNTALYAQGAGLGASKGKDITEVAGLDYAALAKASARERYGQ